MKVWTGHRYYDSYYILKYMANPRTKYWKIIFSPGSQVLFVSFLSFSPLPPFFGGPNINHLLFFPYTYWILISVKYVILLMLVTLELHGHADFLAGSYFSLLVWLGGGGYLVKECESSLEFIVWCSRGKWNYRGRPWGEEAIARPALTPIIFYEGESKHEGGWNQVSALLNLLL